MRLHSPFLYGRELYAGFYPVGGVRHVVVPFCQFVRVGKNGYSGKCGEKGSLICEYGKEGLFLPCNETNAMTVTFEETYLQELYEKGKTSDTLKSNKSFLERLAQVRKLAAAAAL